MSLAASDRAPGLLLGDGAKIGDGCDIGGHVVIHAGAVVGDRCVIGSGVVIHPGVELGAGCRVDDLAILGKRARLAPHSKATGGHDERLPIGEGATIGAGAIVFAGARIGTGAIVADQAHVREGAVIGERTVIGRGTGVGVDTRVGDRVRVQSNVHLTSGVVVEDDVFIGPGTITTNDQTMARYATGERSGGAVIRRASRVGGASVLVPDAEIGEEAFVAAGAVVTRDVPSRAIAMGVPARERGTVPDEDLLERWR
ncbi:MAG: DapH/DapD/GlmU-related protein [Thermoleophilaceae bacterium]